MRTSESINEVASAMAKAQAALKPAVKDAMNPAFRSKYADLASVWSAVRDALAPHGLTVWQDVTMDERGVLVETRIVHQSGQWVEFGPLPIPLGKRDAHGVGSATSYGKRYALAAAVGVVAEEDDDGNAAVASEPAKHAPRPEPAPTAEEVEDALMALAEIAPSGMGAVQAEMESLRPALRDHLRHHEKAKLASIKAAATRAKEPA